MFVAAIENREKTILMVTTAKEVTWLYRQLGIPVQFNISYKMQLTRFWLSVTKICLLELASIIYCIAWSSFSLQRAKTSNSQINRVTERTVCTWVTSKLTYLYIRDVCSVASRAKGYWALPLLTVFIVVVRGESLGTRLLFVYEWQLHSW